MQQHTNDPLVIGGHTFTSRFILGSGKYSLKLIQAALQGNVVLKSDFKVLSSREYGASSALLQVAKATGLDKAIYSKTSEPWVRDCLAMIIGRVV